MSPVGENPDRICCHFDRGCFCFGLSGRCHIIPERKKPDLCILVRFVNHPAPRTSAAPRRGPEPQVICFCFCSCSQRTPCLLPLGPGSALSLAREAKQPEGQKNVSQPFCFLVLYQQHRKTTHMLLSNRCPFDKAHQSARVVAPAPSRITARWGRPGCQAGFPLSRRFRWR